MKKLLVLFFSICASASFAQTWKNPFTNPDGIGDPYIFKDRGTYYLLSSNGEEQKLRCWSSKDLVNWSDPIVCSTDDKIRGAYAPEVVYWNGTYYMYTSPYGGGHYVLTSTSPTGPYKAVTGNVGKVIDGSVFIDDDAKWYFYHADGAGIFGCPMPTPTSIGADVNLNAQMNGQWTEGPCLIKRNGIYYLIYTGNHVLTNGYRIDYGKNKKSPITAFTPQASQNPILIKTEGAFVGLGHGTAFVGPDLDSYYFTYHNLVHVENGSPTRKLSLDRMAFNGDKLMMLGPTNWNQQAPKLAISDYFNRTEIGTDWTMPNGGNWGISNQDLMFQDAMNESSETPHKAIFTKTTASDYTAEFTIKEVAQNNTSGKLGAVFSYSNEQNYGVALLHSFTNQLEINFQTNGTWGSPQFYDLPTGFKHRVWHSIRIEKYAKNYKFFVDNLLKATLTSDLGGGKVGYTTSWSQGHFSYIALSNYVNGAGIFDVYKPIPGILTAVHYNTGGEGVGYHDLTPGNAGGQYIRNDSVDISTNLTGGYHISGNQAGEWYKYHVNVDSTGIYNVGLRYATGSSSCQIRIKQGETDVSGVVNLPSTGGLSAFRTFTIHGLSLTGGYQTLKIEVVNDDFNFYEMQFIPAKNEQMTKTDSFDTAFSSDWNYSDGNWNIESGQASIDGPGKTVMGNTGWTNYTIEADVTYINAMNAGLIFRVNNPSTGGANDNPGAGTDFLQGYFVGLGNTSVTLGKHNYGWATLKSATGSYSLNTSYHIKVVATGANIKVYVTDMTTPKIDYTDPTPFINGRVGFRSCNVHAHFDNLSVKTFMDPISGIKDVSNTASVNGLELYPNPVYDVLTIHSTKKTVAKIYQATGRLVLSKNMEVGNNQIPVEHLSKGLYLVTVDGDGKELTGKFLKE